MSVGLLDADLYQHGAVPFNLDLMKLSTYFKKNKELVSLTHYFCPEKYSKYVVRKDIFDNDFKGFDLANPKVSYGGLGFSSGNYIPLELDIEKNIPDVNIYNKMERYFQSNCFHKDLFKQMIGARHLRLSYDGKTVWEDAFKYSNEVNVSQSIFIHDTNLTNIEGARQFLKDNVNPKTTYIQNKFPLIVNSEEDFLNWYSIPNLGACNTFQYYGILTEGSLEEIVRQKHIRSTRIENIVVDYNTDIQDFLSNQLPTILMQALFLWTNQREISLKYVENVLPKKDIERFLDFINVYIKNANQMRYKKSIYDFIKFIRWRLDKGYDSFGYTLEELREIMERIREYSPEAFRLCYVMDKVTFRNGKLTQGE